jgi:PAS domain S-box-containing protein
VISRLSLKYRIALVILVLEGVMMTMVLWQTLGLSLKSAAEQSALTHDMLTGLVSDLSRSALLTGEYADLQLYLEHVQKEPTVEAIYVADTESHVVSGIPAAMVGKQLPALKDTGPYFWRTEPISISGGSLGTLVVKFSNAALERANAHVRDVGIAIAAVGMLLIAVVGIITGFALTRRLDGISRAARRFADGDLNVQTGVHGKDELADLGQTVDSMIRQVTEGQERLKTQSEQIRLLLEFSGEAIYGIDTAGICTFANPACVKLLGYEHEDELVGEPMHKLIHHSHEDGSPYPAEQCRIRQSFALSGGIHADDEVFWRRDGSCFPVEYWSHPVVRQGTVIGSVVNFIDIAERKAVEAELQNYRQHLEQLVEERTAELTRVNRELEAFSYSVSHDLRAPLRAIDGFGMVLLEDYQDQLDDTAKAHLRRIRAATQRMGALIDDLLLLSRISRADLKKEHVDLSELADAAIQRLKQQDREREVTVDIASGLTAWADANLMRVVMDNLLDNAWKYTGKTLRARIEVNASNESGRMVYRVRDNGAGFDMKYADKLFGTFERLHSADEFPGTGIGLATVKRIIQLHGGRVWGEGQIGQGATFYFTLEQPPGSATRRPGNGR